MQFTVLRLDTFRPLSSPTSHQHHSSLIHQPVTSTSTLQVIQSIDKLCSAHLGAGAVMVFALTHSPLTVTRSQSVSKGRCTPLICIFIQHDWYNCNTAIYWYNCVFNSSLIPFLDLYNKCSCLQNKAENDR